MINNIEIMNNNFRFDSETHTYYYNNIKVLNVTEIINLAGLSGLNNVPEYILLRKAELGSQVHKLIYLYEQNKLDITKLNPLYHDYLEIWLEVKDKYGFEILSTEIPLYSELYQFAGTYDIIACITKGRYKDKIVLIDLKSGVVLPSVFIQTAAYKILADENLIVNKKINLRMVISFYKRPYDKMIKDFDYHKSTFLSALQTVKFKLTEVVK